MTTDKDNNDYYGVEGDPKYLKFEDGLLGVLDNKHPSMRKFEKDIKKSFSELLFESFGECRVVAKDVEKLSKTRKQLLNEANKALAGLRSFTKQQVKCRTSFFIISPLVPFMVDTSNKSPIVHCIDYLNKYIEDINNVSLPTRGSNNPDMYRIALRTASLYHYFFKKPLSVAKASREGSPLVLDTIYDYLEIYLDSRIPESTRISACKEIKRKIDKR